jgi:hypothetical protein
VEVRRTRILTEFERLLEDRGGARKDLHTLVEDGCNQAELSSVLQLAFLANESWQALVGMNLRGFKTVLAEIKNCADIVERLNRSELIHRLSIEHRNPLFVGLHDSPTLPDRLREYAKRLDQQTELFGPKRNHRKHLWKALIVAIVTEDTKRPHDAEVSAIIAAVLKDMKYSEKAHQAWRLKHRSYIERMRALRKPPLMPPPRPRSL